MNTNQRNHTLEKELLPHIDAIYNFAYHLTGNEHDASDLVQETYIKALRYIKSYESGTSGRSWLFRITKTLFINQYNKQKRQPKPVKDEETSELLLNQLEFSENNLSDRFQISDEVHRALARLTPEYRMILLLCYIEGFSYNELCAVLDLPMGTVKTRLSRAKKKFATYYKQYEADEAKLEVA